MQGVIAFDQVRHLNKQRSKEAKKLEEMNNKEVSAKEFAREKSKC